MRKTSRSYSEISRELQDIRDKAPHLGKVFVMCEALWWGYASARTCWTLESNLYRTGDMESLVQQLADSWDGQEYLGGALGHAQKFFDKPLYG